MITLGLTGSIGMGKSTLAAALRDMGFPVHEADRCVHALLDSRGKAAELVRAAFGPAVMKNGAVDRQRLAAKVFSEANALEKLEKILHPLVQAEEQQFLARSKQEGAALAVLEIPLLFETGAEARCDYTLLATAPAFIQKRRVLARPNMTPARFAAIRARQMAEAAKKRRADFIIQTGLPLFLSLRQLRRILKMILDPGAVKKNRG